jgi:hypothetical protein
VNAEAAAWSATAGAKSMRTASGSISYLAIGDLSEAQNLFVISPINRNRDRKSKW